MYCLILNLKSLNLLSKPLIVVRRKLVSGKVRQELLIVYDLQQVGGLIVARSLSAAAQRAEVFNHAEVLTVRI